MPYLRLTAPALPFEQKKIMAMELTDALLETLGVFQVSPESVIVHFVAYQPEDLSLGGRLVSEIEEPVYRLEVFDATLPAAKRRQLLLAIRPLLLELLAVPAAEEHRLTVLFPEYFATTETSLSLP